MQAYCLSFHASYVCGHSGRCCTAPWPLPIERDTVERLRAGGFIRGPAHAHVRSLSPPVNGLTLALATTPSGACVFFDDARGRLCRVHRDGGPELLPEACRNFPRVTLRDGRGTFITLSSYCPTAARLLLDGADIAIVAAPDSLSLGGSVEGLDATQVMPPLLRPGMLMDLEGYACWEAEGVRALADTALTPQAARRVIAEATRDICMWRPGGETLTRRVERAFARCRALAAGPTAVTRLDRAVKAFLASHLFASWAAYQGGGLAAVVAELDRALALVGSGHEDDEAFLAAVGAADLQLRHAA